MPKQNLLSTMRRASVLALSAVLVAGVTSLAPSSASPTSSPVEDAGQESDAIVYQPTAADLRRAVVDHSPPGALRTDANPHGRSNRRADAGNVIDVAFVYPAALPAQADVGGIDGLRARFAKAIAESNTAFTNSGVPLQLRMVGDRQVAAPTSVDYQTMLKQLATPSDGVYDEAQALREETHADLVSLWASGSVPRGETCGVGYLGGLDPREAEFAAWTMVFYTDCADDGLVFTHEVGHNLSGDHDPAASSPPKSSSKPYARGYTDPAHKFISVMSYAQACFNINVTDCVRRPYFSGPNVRTSEGYPVGSAAADNARALSEQGPLVANYRQSQIYGAAPTISGTPNSGRDLIANVAGWAPANVTFGYQWYANGVPIAGATGSTLRLGDAQVATSITVGVTGSAPYYAPVSVGSAATGVIGKQLFSKTHKPRIKGAARVGAKLQAVVKAWKPGKKVKYKFTWFRNGKAIKGAKGKTYRVGRKDRGKKVWVTVTGKRSGFESVTKTSKKKKIRR